MNVLQLTDKNFEEEVLNSAAPVLVDFWASWCGPCKMLSPIIDELASEVDFAKIGKVNVDQQAELAQAFGVMSIPTLIVLRNGKVTNKVVGVRSKESLKQLLKD